MTAEMQSALTRELEDAQDIADTERRRDAVQTVQSHRKENRHEQP
jgi:hypothetical protein